MPLRSKEFNAIPYISEYTTYPRWDAIQLSPLKASMRYA